MPTPRAAALGGAVVYALTAAAAGVPPLAVVRAGIGGAALAPAALVELRERREPTRFVRPALGAFALLWVVGAGRLGAAAGPLLVAAALLALRARCPGTLARADVEAALLVAFALGARALAALLLGLGLGAAALVALSLHDAAPAGRGPPPFPLAPFLAIGALVALSLP